MCQFLVGKKFISDFKGEVVVIHVFLLYIIVCCDEDDFGRRFLTYVWHVFRYWY